MPWKIQTTYPITKNEHPTPATEPVTSLPARQASVLLRSPSGTSQESSGHWEVKVRTWSLLDFCWQAALPELQNHRAVGRLTRWLQLPGFGEEAVCSTDYMGVLGSSPSVQQRMDF